jgi:hypothetical protein
MSQGRVKHEFVEFIPQEVEPATVYISGTHATCVHLCLCGCGNKVVTPLAPTEWKLIFDGETISLSPSIGNWSFDCQSHYWIRESRVIWAPALSKEKVEANRVGDRRQKHRYYRELEDDATAVLPATGEEPHEQPGWLLRVLRHLRPWRRQ